ncbi:MAG: ABC transporter ATP-binding protein [Dehalococcoidales bacterium]|nr:ABC transporter ATP-binding protein [Dehalococcoidales bacterium]
MIFVENLYKTYGHDSAATHALKGVDLEVKAGEFAAIMGRSGSGKSTLLHILGLLDVPNSGSVLIDRKDVLKLTEGQKARFRLAELGYVFQEYSLLPEMTILENVYIPAVCLGSENGYRKRAAELLEIVGLGERLKHYPNEISGGEQQRVSIARALINRPKILFADEPTASLDIASATVVLELFKKLNKEMGQTILMVTHEPEDEKHVDRVIWLKDGIIDKDIKSNINL